MACTINYKEVTSRKSQGDRIERDSTRNGDDGCLAWYRDARVMGESARLMLELMQGSRNRSSDYVRTALVHPSAAESHGGLKAF